MKSRAMPIFLAFFVMGFVDAVGTLVGFAQKEFGISGAMAGLLPFFGFVAFALLSVPAGVLAARQGKRFVMLLALSVVLLGQLLPSISLTHYSTLVFAIFFIGIGMTLLQVAGNPILRDVSAPELYARNLTFAQFIKSLGSISGPYATTALIALGFAWTRIFPVFAAVTLTALLAVMALRLEEGRREERPASLGSSLGLLKDPMVAAFVAGIFFYVGAEVGLNSWLATHLSTTHGMDLGSEATRLGPGLFFICLAAGRLLGLLILGFLKPRDFLLVTTLLSLAGVLALLFGSRGTAVLGVAACGLGFANVWPLVFSIVVERRPERAGELSGLMCTAIFGGAAIPPVMGFIADWASIRWSFLVPLVAFLICLSRSCLAERAGDSIRHGVAMRFDGDPRTVLTLDAGGTNFVFSALRGNREVAAPRTLPARGDDLPACLDTLIRGFSEIAAAAGGEAAAISFAFPGPADYPGGIIGDLGNLPAFRGGVALGPMLEERFRVPVFINNDGDLFAYGEAMAGLLPEVNVELAAAGSPKRFRNLLGFTLGTGFGGGIVHDGRLLLGDNSAAGEVWLLRHKLDRDSFAEEGVSIRAVRRAYAEAAGLPFGEAPEPKELLAIALGSAPGNAGAAREAFRRLGEVAGDAIANALTLVDGLVVLGGGLAGAASLFLPALIDELNGSFASVAGGKVNRLELKAFNLEDPGEREKFLRSAVRSVPIPGTSRTVAHDSVKRIGVGLTRLGTSRAVAMGAYAFALERLGGA